MVKNNKVNSNKSWNWMQKVVIKYYYEKCWRMYKSMYVIRSKTSSNWMVYNNVVVVGFEEKYF